MHYIIRQAVKQKPIIKTAFTLLASIRLMPLVAILLLAGGIFATNRTTTFFTTANDAPNVHIDTPAMNAAVNATIKLSADVTGVSTSEYDMFWYVDNGRWNWMDAYGDPVTKQADIDFTQWTWHGNDSDYTIVVVAVMHNTGQRAYSSVAVHAVQSSTAQAQVAAAPNPTSKVQTMSNLYVNPSSSAAAAAASSSDPTVKRVMGKLATVPTATWLGSWNANVEGDARAVATAAANAQQTPLFVAYNIPDRDCGGYSSGGASSPDAYRSWISQVAAGIGNHNAIVILEPDATAQTTCLSSSDLATRNQLLSQAIVTLKTNPGTKVYLDAGNPSWIPTLDMAERLKAAGIAQADGFSLNVSNFIATNSNVSYGTQISQAVGGKHFVIDTSRNGNGSSSAWCNPSGRALGTAPTSNTGNALADYYLWIKTPGESDGMCNGGPAAGVWWPEYATTLALNAGW